MPSSRLPSFPLRPGRPAFSRRVRLWLVIVLGGAVVVAFVVGLVLAHSSKAPLRIVTIPAADRSASAALLRAAEAVRFVPAHESGAGKIEDEPRTSASSPLTHDLLGVGSTAPAFTAQTPTGDTISLASLRGKVVLLDFFTTWCPHCAAEAPHVQRLYASLPHSRYAFVAVDANSEDAPSVLAYHIYFGLGFPAVLDPGGHTVTFPHHGPQGPITNAYHVGAYPTFYVLDPTGRIAWRNDGEQPDALLRGQLVAAARQ